MVEYYKNLSLESIHYINEEGVLCIEEFRDIPGYEGSYQVSDLGRVKSLARKIYREYDNATLNKKERILKGSVEISGYPFVNLYLKNESKLFKIHRLVMITFIGYSDKYIDHKDDIRYNNILSNLRYCTQRENNTIYKKSFGTSQFMGVVLLKNNKWNSSITINNKAFNLGNYFDELEASNAYKKALYQWEDKNILPNYRLKQKTSKYIGVCKRKSKWISQYKGKHIGIYDSEEMAYLELLKYKLNNGY